MCCVQRRYKPVAIPTTKFFPRSDVWSRALHVPKDDASVADSAIQHFHDKLLHIKDGLKTKPGKRMGEKRHQFVRCSLLLFLTCVDRLRCVFRC